MSEDEPMWLYTMADYMDKPFRVRLNAEKEVVEIDGKSIEPTPIEDYGDYLLKDGPVEDAFTFWRVLTGSDFVTSDGYRLRYDKKAGHWTDGDLCFEADESLHPVDDQAERLEGDFEQPEEIIHER